MKLVLIILASLVSLNAMAFNVCKFEETYEISKAVDAGKIKKVKVSKDHKKFTAIEKKMVFMALKTDKYNSKVTASQALQIFGDFDENGKTPGYNAGVIEYFTSGTMMFALVHYWPGDNEYGAFIEVKKNDELVMMAAVTDSFIECK